MARRALHALTASVIVGGTIMLSAPGALADYPNINPPAGGGTIGGSSGGSVGGSTPQTGAGGGAATGRSLPFTGAEVLPLAGFGAALLFTGSIAIVAGRRRSLSPTR